MVVFAIFAQAIFTLTTTSFDLISFSRARVTAKHLAQERMEIIRNLPYDSIGTVGGIPSGTIPQEENIVKNGLNYTISTSIVYVDDEFDEVAPSDTLPTDYKRIRIGLSWEGVTSKRSPVVFVTDIAPRGIETTVGGGTLSILVFDANAQPIAQADVNILADSLDPQVNLDLQTNDNGWIVLPGTPTCISCYQITVTKDGFSTEKTYSVAEVANPNKPHLSIIESELSEVSFAIDQVSTVNFTSVSDRTNNFNPIGNVTFQLRGQKTLGTDVSDLPIYKYDEVLTTDAGGNLSIENLEWDNYDVFLPSTGSYDIAATNPLVPLNLLPDSLTDLTFIASSKTLHRLYAIFTDSSSTLISSVSATLSDKAGFNQTKLSGSGDDPDTGQVFFPNLSAIKYSLTATAAGFIDFDTSIKVSDYTKDIFILTAE